MPPQVPREHILRAQQADFKQILKLNKLTIYKDNFIICPFHDDKNPSLGIDFEKNIFHCFGCGSKGNIIGFVQQYYHIPFNQAVSKLLPFAPPTATDVVQFQKPKEDIINSTRDKIEPLYHHTLNMIIIGLKFNLHSFDDYLWNRYWLEAIMWEVDEVLEMIRIGKENLCDELQVKKNLISLFSATSKKLSSFKL
jgi:hypothetical protein